MPARKSGPVEASQVSQEGRDMALFLAGGDKTRLKTIDRNTIIVTNQGGMKWPPRVSQRRPSSTSVSASAPTGRRRGKAATSASGTAKPSGAGVPATKFKSPK